jgi:hypothetical protein
LQDYKPKRIVPRNVLIRFEELLSAKGDKGETCA